jgi:type IV pilus assembly protein PilF
MTATRGHRPVRPQPVTTALLCLALAGCAGTGLNPDEDPLGLDPENSPAALYVQMAEEYYNRGQPDVAFRRAQQAIEADKNYPKAHIWLGFMYEEIGKPDQAVEHYRRALQLAPKNSDVLFAAGAFQCRRKDYADADHYFKRALANPLYATPWLAMTLAGDCAGSAGQSAQAETYYRSAIAANPTFGPALVKLATIELKNGNAQGAKVYLDRYFEPTTLRTAETARLALETAVRTETALGNSARAAEYERLLGSAFQDTAATRQQ